jgi:hypothetical protein
MIDRASGVRGQLVLLAVGLVASVALAACSGAAMTPTPTPPPSPTPMATPTDPATDTPTPETPAPTEAALPDPCSLLTQDEADNLAGEKLGTPLPEGNPPTNCVWPTPLTGSVAQVEVGVGDGAKKYLDIDKDTLGHAFTQLSDLGDEAWQESDTVFVRTGTLWFSLHLVKLDAAPDDLSNMAALAKTILGRIGQ